MTDLGKNKLHTPNTPRAMTTHLRLLALCAAWGGLCYGSECRHATAADRPATTNSTPASPRTDDGPRAFVQKRYPDARILDQDYDDGFIEVKMKHRGTEKIAVFGPDGQWLRTLWEIDRDRLPRTVVEGLEHLGIPFRDIDDNDNKAFEDRRGTSYAVQVRHRGQEYVLLMGNGGDLLRRFYDDEWDDARDKGHWCEDGEDHFDEGDDEWDDTRRHSRRHHEDDGEDRFDEGDDEGDDGEE